MFGRPDRSSDNGGNEVKHHYKMRTLCHAECRRFGSFATSDQNLADKVLLICCLQINLISPEAIDSVWQFFVFLCPPTLPSTCLFTGVQKFPAFITFNEL